jgi:predicted ATP-grasp superfamily ATP-dependent carboligase
VPWPMPRSKTADSQPKKKRGLGILTLGYAVLRQVATSLKTIAHSIVSTVVYPKKKQQSEIREILKESERRKERRCTYQHEAILACRKSLTLLRAVVGNIHLLETIDRVQHFV